MPGRHYIKANNKSLFLQREHVNHNHVCAFLTYDPQSMIISLRSCYTTTINNIYFRNDLLSTQEVVVLLIDKISTHRFLAKLDFTNPHLEG